MKGCGYFEDIDKRFMYQKNLTSFNYVQYFLRNDQKCTKNRDFFSVPSVTPKIWGLIGQKFYLLSGNSNRVTLLDDNL